MSFFPRSFLSHPSSHSPFGFDNTSSSSSFHPLFRLLDDFDNYSRSSSSPSSHGGRQQHIMRSFTPKFDVKETADAYELHGELPGIDQKDIEIEFVDAETITIKGRTERSYTSGTPPTTAGAIESGSGPAAIKDKAHQPTVEDEESAFANANTGEKDTQVAKVSGTEKKQEIEHSKEKFWISERSVGEFSRSFTFPVRVEQDAVKASMKNGVLSVVVPKGKKIEGRKISIE